jgi:ankyrin repeat protein
MYQLTNRNRITIPGIAPLIFFLLSACVPQTVMNSCEKDQKIVNQIAQKDPELLDIFRRTDPNLKLFRTCESRNYITVLGAAASYGNLALAELLLERGAEPDAESEGGATALDYAASSGSIEIASLLLKHGANPNSGYPDRSTPLDTAKAMGHGAIVDLLVKAGGMSMCCAPN